MCGGGWGKGCLEQMTAWACGAHKRGRWRCCLVGSDGDAIGVDGGSCAVWLQAWKEGGDDYGILIFESGCLCLGNEKGLGKKVKIRVHI